ncbi:MAG: Ig-like domain-containing protein [Segetibacter sp.]
MKTILTLLFVCFLHSAWAATYYFSTLSGDDSRTSTQARNPSTPWKTISKLNSFFSSLQPGDSVLFKRDETFYGSVTISRSGIKGSPIVISAYGIGNRPVITGLTTLTNWADVGNGIYESYNSSLGATLNMLLLNDALQPIGRYPNTGYLKLESHSGNTITDNELPSTPNWTGAELVLRTNHWKIDRYKITNHSGNTITSTGTYAQNNYGYFIQNSIKALDQLGEWSYDSSSKKVSMYFGAESPLSFKVTASALDYVIYSSGRSYVVFNNLTLKGANKNIVNLSGGNNLQVRNCDVLFAGINGVSASGTYFNIENCTVLNSNNNGIGAGSSAVIRNNIVKNSYAIAGMGQGGDGQGVGIRVNNSSIAEYNQVINTGYCGIVFGGDYGVVKNNYIDTFCFIKDDGAGIYTNNNSNITNKGRKIIGNIVLNGIGAPAGTNTSSSSAQGIYLDNNVNGLEMIDNTVANCNRGVFFHNTRDIIVRNNTFYNNNNGQIYIGKDNLGNLIRNNTIINNVLFSRIAKQAVSSVNTNLDSSDIASMGRLDSNYYARPIDDNAIIANTIYYNTSNQYRVSYDLEGWKLQYNLDRNSKTSVKKISPYKINSLTGSNKCTYGSFSSSSDVAKVWANSSTKSWANSGVLDGGYLKVVPTAKSSSIVLTVGSLSSAKKYILRFSVKSSARTNISAYLRASYSAKYAALTIKQGRTMTTTRSENEMLFTPSANETSGSIVFSVDAQTTYYVDNVKLYEADATVTNPDDSIRFVFNASQVSKTVSLNGNYVDAKNNKYPNTITLQPYASAVLISNEGIQNTAPTVSITSPAAAATFDAPASVTISAVADDADGTISKVEFYNRDTLLGTVAESPYTFTWNNVPAGSYTITAKATDNSSLVSTSAAVAISVISANVSPSVRIISIGTSTTLGSPSSVTITAAADDVDGTVSKVEFYNYNADTLLGTVTASPYTFTWNNVPAGDYTITAKATDNKGAVTMSSKVTISVVPPTVSLRSSNKPSNALSNPDTSASSFKVFPNPARNTVFVSGKGLLQNKGFIISVVSMDGKVLKTIRSNTLNKAVEVNISSLSSGVYIIKATAGFITINKQFVKL